MKNNVLYYPYIKVPDNDWFIRVLLYWDNIGSIVPYEYIHSPDRLGKHMCSLLAEGLVTQIIPSSYIYEVPNFTDAFIQRAEAFKAQNNIKVGSLASMPTFRVHIEKLDNIGDELCKIGLARKSEYPWYELESRLANNFMAYLVGVLCELPDVYSHPITDTLNQLQLYEPCDNLRTLVLEDLLPAPSDGVSAADLCRFKSKNAQYLTQFRNEIEKSIIVAASINNDVLQKEYVSRFFVKC